MKIARRTFLKFAGFASSFLFLFTTKIPQLFGGKWEHGEKEWWTGDIFHQDNVNTNEIEKGIISARIDGVWREFKVRELSDDFLKWNFSSRKENLEKIGKIMGGGEGEMNYAGPHSGSVATYGGGRKDSRFTINNAVKGMGFVPIKKRLKETISHLEETISKPMPMKLNILKKNYEDTTLFDKTRQVSLELYATPTFETHTFLNLMENPVCSIVFLDIPSYELRCIARMIHPDDPQALQYEKDVSHYTNLVHSYFHGKFKKQFITTIYYVIEEFDNTPGEKKGVRTVPTLPAEEDSRQ
jgi:hypothetical protein